MNELVNIQMISDGDGKVLVFINGKPDGTYFCKSSLSAELEQLLEKHLVEYPLDSTDEEKLPF